MPERDPALAIRSWLDATYRSERDAEQFMERLLEDVPGTPQRPARRWTLRPFGRRSGPITADLTTELRSVPPPAINGHHPTVIGRTQVMFSPAKAIIAGAVIFALGGVLFVAQPSSRQGTGGPAAEADGEPAPPTEFSGHIVCGPEVRTGTDERETFQVADEDWWLARSRGWAWRPTASMSDPRLEGTYYVAYDSDEYRPVLLAAATQRVGSETWRIENDEGAWQGSLTNVYGSDDQTSSGSALLVGEGAYEGLTLYWEEEGHWDSCTWDVRGLIIEGGALAAPQPFIPE